MEKEREEELIQKLRQQQRENDEIRERLSNFHPNMRILMDIDRANPYARTSNNVENLLKLFLVAEMVEDITNKKNE